MRKASKANNPSIHSSIDHTHLLLVPGSVLKLKDEEGEKVPPPPLPPLPSEIGTRPTATKTSSSSTKSISRGQRAKEGRRRSNGTHECPAKILHFCEEALSSAREEYTRQRAACWPGAPEGRGRREELKGRYNILNDNPTKI